MPDTHAISFRIDDSGNYAERWRTVVEKIRDVAESAAWEETTSFFVIQSSMSADTLATVIYADSEFDSDKDALLVINLSEYRFATEGKIENRQLLRQLLTGPLG